jgi:hypothetical protein
MRLDWDEKFGGVFHDTRTIAGFVAEYRWLSNHFSADLPAQSHTTPMMLKASRNM